MRYILIFTLLLVAQSLHAQDKPVYRLFDSSGKEVLFAEMIKDIASSDIILFGEYHNNPISHWLQLETARELGSDGNLVMGAEMFERDNEEALQLYLKGEITSGGLDSMARLWSNYKTDYAPLVNFAKENGIGFHATNIPRRYASMVSRGGFHTLDTLTNEEYNWIAPLPIEYDSTLPGYVQMLEMMAGHGGPNLPKAQAMKDATMAHFILQHFEKGKVFLHFNGAYHSDNYEGILWYLQQSRPDLKYSTITTVSQADLSALEEGNKGKADYIICVDADMTTTY